MIKYFKKMAPYLIIAIFFVSIDRIFKLFALNYLEYEKIPVFGDIFGLSLAKNYFIAFSLPLSGPILNYFICVIILILIYYWLYLINKQDFKSAGYLTIVLFGAINNIIDRFKYGYVIDYLDLKYFTVFNFADAMIVGGVFLFLKIQLKINEKRI